MSPRNPNHPIRGHLTGSQRFETATVVLIFVCSGTPAVARHPKVSCSSCKAAGGSKHGEQTPTVARKAAQPRGGAGAAASHSHGGLPVTRYSWRQPDAVSQAPPPPDTQNKPPSSFFLLKGTTLFSRPSNGSKYFV